jgi:hypothetical protein
VIPAMPASTPASPPRGAAPPPNRSTSPSPGPRAPTSPSWRWSTPARCGATRGATTECPPPRCSRRRRLGGATPRSCPARRFGSRGRGRTSAQAAARPPGFGAAG